MQLHSDSFTDGDAIPPEHAFGQVDSSTHTALAPNRNPHLAWDGAPGGTRSLVVICVDGDVPTRADDVNQEGREVPADLPRTDFYHWVLIDLPAHVRSLDAGAWSEGVVARGKDVSAAPYEARQGSNDFTGLFAGDSDMEGQYRGYDGPCPPWNDSLIHHYEFTVYATDLDRVPVNEPFDAAAVLAAIDGHVLASSTITGTYTLNPRLGG